MQHAVGYSIRTTLQPGDIGAITWLHGTLYATEYGWDYTFEAYVSGPLTELALNLTPRSRIWVVEHQSRVAGSIAICEVSQELAQLRWFLVHPTLRGRGIGKELMNAALDFCRKCYYQRVFLWTVAGLPASRALYDAAGFHLTEEKAGKGWGRPVTEQRFDLELQ